jgi:hypothetical protein
LCGRPVSTFLVIEECREAGSEEQLLREISKAYRGKVIAGHDLDVY